MIKALFKRDAHTVGALNKVEHTDDTQVNVATLGVTEMEEATKLAHQLDDKV